MKPRALMLAFLGLALSLAHAPAEAGLRWIGKYCGVVLFDRWDTCYLYSGVYLMYVSQKVKEGLRPYAGQAMQINATDVSQPINPGDGLIKSYTVLGPAPDTDDWLGPLTELHLTADMRVVKGKPEFRMTIFNGSPSPLTIHADHLAATVLMKRTHEWPFDVSDGPSQALMTRWDLQLPPYGCAITAGRKFYWQVASGPVPGFTTLAPGHEMVVRMLFNVPPGEYEFLCGYGGGCHKSKCVASNLVAFDVDANRVAHAVEVPGR